MAARLLKSLKRAQKQHTRPEDIIDPINALSSEEFATRFLPPAHALTCYKDYDITLKPVTRLDASEFDACFKLIKHTSAEAYKGSSRGWDPKDKKREMREDNMQYLLVRRRPCVETTTSGKQGSVDSATPSCGKTDTSSVPGDIVAFLSFMLTIEDGYPVNYIYEIHMYEKERGRGLGQRLMLIVQRISEETKVSKVMLTVFTSNTAATGFYNMLGFVEDEYSPPAKRLRGGKVKRPSYMIMSKSVD